MLHYILYLFGDEKEHMTNKQATIAVLRGDGIGKEVAPEAEKVLLALAEKFGYTIKFTYAALGLDAYRKTNDTTPFPEETIEICRQADAMLKGPIGDDKGDKAPAGIVEKAVIGIRTTFDLFANLRPCKVYPGFEYLSPIKEDIVRGTDFVIVRENVSGLYPPRGRFEPGEIADFGQDMSIYSRRDVHRIAKVAYDLARQRRKKVTIVAKKNVLASSRAFALYAEEIAKEYPDVTTDYHHVDATTIYLMTKPTSYDVILTTNMFGDILSDQGGGVMGSLGLAWSVNIGEKTTMYECVGGSAPDIAGQDKANPLAMILSATEVFRYTLKDPEPSELAQKIVEQLLNDGWRTGDLARDTTPDKILGCKAMGDKVVEYIKKA